MVSECRCKHSTSNILDTSEEREAQNPKHSKCSMSDDNKSLFLNQAEEGLKKRKETAPDVLSEENKLRNMGNSRTERKRVRDKCT